MRFDGRLGGAPAWEDDPGFDLDLHVHRLGVPAPGDRGALQELVSDLVATPLDRSKPLWDIYLLEGYGSGCAVLVRMHHAIADGIPLGRVMLSLTDTDGELVEFAPGAPPDAGLGSRAAALVRPASAAISAGRTLVHEGVEMLSRNFANTRASASTVCARLWTRSRCSWPTAFAARSSRLARRARVAGRRTVVA